MAKLPARMIDRWQDRAEPGPGEGTVYWHVLMKDHPQVVDLAREAQKRLAKFSGLHMTPLEHLHMTMLAVGAADQFSHDQFRHMIRTAEVMLADTHAITVTVGDLGYYPEAIVLGVMPRQELATVHNAVRAATQAVTGNDHLYVTAPRWLPHVTICYSTADQATAPIVEALGPQQRQCRIQVATVSLVIQRGPERLWDWHVVDTVHLSPTCQLSTET